MDDLPLGPTEHGWLRRPECDTRTGDVWELPDGKLVALQRGCRPSITGVVRYATLTDADREYLRWRAGKRWGKPDG
jgi:hypothetical protein